MLRAAAGNSSSVASDDKERKDVSGGNSTSDDIKIKENEAASVGSISVSHQETLTSSDDEFHDCDDVSEHRIM